MPSSPSRCLRDSRYIRKRDPCGEGMCVRYLSPVRWLNYYPLFHVSPRVEFPMSNKQASDAVAALQAKRRANNKPYLGDDAGGSAKMPPSTSAWAVQWKPPSTASRKELQVRAEVRV